MKSEGECYPSTSGDPKLAFVLRKPVPTNEHVYARVLVVQETFSEALDCKEQNLFSLTSWSEA